VQNCENRAIKSPRAYNSNVRRLDIGNVDGASDVGSSNLGSQLGFHLGAGDQWFSFLHVGFGSKHVKMSQESTVKLCSTLIRGIK
jgi:hypothetical protein